jgi:ABC-type phosphate/phosphonate transport system permease subunit
MDEFSKLSQDSLSDMEDKWNDAQILVLIAIVLLVYAFRLTFENVNRRSMFFKVSFCIFTLV